MNIHRFESLRSSTLLRGVLVGALHLALLGAVYGRFAYDRARLPRSWVAVRVVDPDSLVRGRYLALQTTDTKPPLYFNIYIPEHARVPELRPGEELWAEISRAKNAPRPIRLAIRSNGQMRPINTD